MIARRLDKRSKIEELMKTIIEDAQNLVNYHTVKSASPTLFIKLGEIVKEIVLLTPSLPTDKIDTQAFHNYSTQIISTGSSI